METLKALKKDIEKRQADFRKAQEEAREVLDKNAEEAAEASWEMQKAAGANDDAAYKAGKDRLDALEASSAYQRTRLKEITEAGAVTEEQYLDYCNRILEVAGSTAADTRNKVFILLAEAAKEGEALAEDLRTADSLLHCLQYELYPDGKRKGTFTYIDKQVKRQDWQVVEWAEHGSKTPFYKAEAMKTEDGTEEGVENA